MTKKLSWRDANGQQIFISEKHFQVGASPDPAKFPLSVETQDLTFS